ncbi:hypothetical protein [Aurantiacibacter sediminis]|uniref:DUF302 domain-containing protein n=1 Tax=Aurantiacibacter sediminis TaxID=2793064 RepID=A0ABS0N319_9SPHN|nr:hypothetical protein [Aurantiacibacter sediminis]MBH5322356.1 hypothetical protein [Aurantiacibacter sediminis]
MHKSLTTLALAAGIAAFSAPAAAQSAPTSLRLLVEDTTATSQRCGVTSQQLMQELRTNIRAQGIREASSDDFAAPILYARTNVDENQDLCFGSIEVRIQAYDYMPILTTPNQLFGSMVYCNSAEVFSEPRRISNFTEIVRDHVRLCLDDVRSRAETQSGGPVRSDK